MQCLRLVSLGRKAASQRDICCLSVFLRSPVPARLRGLPLSHLGVNSLIMRDQRRNPVSPMVFIFGCVAFVAAVLFSNLCAYKFGKYQGWRELLRKHTKYQRKHIALNEGE